MLGAVDFLTQQDSDAILSPKHRTGTALFTNPVVRPKRMTGGWLYSAGLVLRGML